MIQAGIKEVIGPNRKFTGKGAGEHYSIDHAEQMLREAGVKIRYYEIDRSLDP